MIVRSAVTGMTVTFTAAGDIGAFSIPAVLTGVGNVYAQKEVLPYNPFAWVRGDDLEIAPGEGLMIYQSVAGTATDPRRFKVSVQWIELDLT